jgi:hypothetical protein
MVCIATSEKFLRGSRTTPYVDQPASRVERRFPGVPAAETGIARSAAGGGPGWLVKAGGTDILAVTMALRGDTGAASNG